MKLVTIGDSITKGTFTDVGQDAPNSIAVPYGELLSKSLNCEFINYGINGISYSKTSSVNSEYSIENNLKNCDLGDLTIVAAGTNDFGTSVKIEDFKAAVEYAFTYLKEHAKKVFVLSPLPRIHSQSNAVGHSLDEYRQIINTYAKAFDFHLIDGNKFELDPNKQDVREKYILDGTHLNNEAHILLSKFILEEIKNG